MTGVAAATTIFVEVIGSSAAHEQYMLQPGGAGADSFAFGAAQLGAASLNVSAVAVIASATLYGRKFEADRLPYSCPKDLFVVRDH